MSSDVPLPDRRMIDRVEEGHTYAYDPADDVYRPVTIENGQLQVDAEQTSFAGLEAFSETSSGAFPVNDVGPGADVVVQADPTNTDPIGVGPAGGPYAITLEPGDSFHAAVSDTSDLGVDLPSGNSANVAYEI